MKAGKKQGMSSIRNLYDSEGKFEDYATAVRMAHRLYGLEINNEEIEFPFIGTDYGVEFYVNRVAKNEYAITMYDDQTKVFKTLSGGDITEILGLQKAVK